MWTRLDRHKKVWCDYCEKDVLPSAHWRFNDQMKLVCVQQIRDRKKKIKRLREKQKIALPWYLKTDTKDRW